MIARTAPRTLMALVALSAVPAVAQTPAIPQFPPGPGYTGVAGTVEENARIEKLCGPNRNVRDGYFAPPMIPGQARAPILPHDPNLIIEKFAQLDRSIGMAFLPGGKILVSQRAGGMRTVDRSGAVSEPVAGAPSQADARLTTGSDILLDKGFAKNRTLYYGFVARAEAAGQPAEGRIIRAKLSADDRKLEDVTVIYRSPDFTPRRLVQLKDGTILIASAEVASGGPKPQSLQSGLGKVLRINADGSIPKNNPFLKTAGANPALYSVGFRDIQGLALDPATGKPWVAENTPMGGDELNIIKAGGNYGFPVISYGRENSGALINGGKTAQEGMEQPVYYWTPSIAPSGMAFYDGKAFKAWKGDVLVGAMSGKQLVRLKMKNGKVVGEEKLLMDRCKRIKDVRTGPDGFVYVMTDETPSEILRLSPKV